MTVRLVAGRAGGRRLAVPPGARPTADRTREALFSSLAGELDLPGARVLDLYAGSGALGLEAASRGAAHVLLVDSSPAAVRALRANVNTLGLAGVEVRATAVERLPAAGPVGAPYDLLLADPPYSLAAADLRSVLTGLLGAGWLAAGALLVLERASRDPVWTWPEGVRGLRDRRYGEGSLWYGRRPL